MSTKLSGGSASNTGNTEGRRLGIKKYGGETVKSGAIIVRQRGTKILPGKNVSVGKDHTLFALTAGTVKYSSKRQVNFDGTDKRKKVVNVEAVPAK